MNAGPGAPCKDPRRLRSCIHCLAWGILWRPRCSSCFDFARRNPVGTCRTCGREIPVRDGVCRLCRKQATFIAKWENHGYDDVDLTVAATTGHQLFFAGMESFRGSTPHGNPSHAAAAASGLALVAAIPGTAVVQLRLCDPPRDIRRASSLTPPRDPDLLDLLLGHAGVLAERQGWNTFTRRQVRYGLKLLAACHEPGEPIKTSTVHALSPLQIPTRRMLHVLHTADVDRLLLDDHADSLTVLIDDRFADLPAQLRQELQVWVGVLRHGDSRRRARPEATVRTRLALVGPFATEVAAHYDSLRQITPDDVTKWLDRCTRPSDALSALRDLFRVLKAHRLIFANPTTRIHRSRPNLPTPNPLTPQALQQIGRAAEHDPELRVLVALIGVHALWPRQIRHLLLTDVDLPNRRLHLAHTDRAIDPFTATAITDYLTHRRQRWPRTRNPHLLVSSVSANDDTPVSPLWPATRFQNLPTTPGQLRQDRILEEALATGADPLHLTAMFGFTAETALRYARVVAPELAHLTP